MEKKGLKGLGFLRNLKLNENRINCYKILSKMTGKPIDPENLDAFIDSEAFSIEYYDAENELCGKDNSLKFKFKTPYVTKFGEPIYGIFERKNVEDIFSGVTWEYEPSISRCGTINPSCFLQLQSLCGDKNVCLANIDSYVAGRFEYFNGAGHQSFPDGTHVTEATGKFARFLTTFHTTESSPIYGWFTKNTKGRYEGINWGTDMDFKSSRKDREQFFVGRFVFETLDSCNTFLSKLVDDKTIIEEPWEYKNRTDPTFRFPILKSYLQFELERLFYEHEELHYEDKIVYNRDKTKIIFNTNLIDKFGHDLIIAGDVLNIGGKEYVANLDMRPRKLNLKKMGFDNFDPIPPQFFKDVNEIVFHCDWEIDCNVEQYEHIIEDRIDRFPSKYRTLSTDELGLKLDNAIDFAKRIAQRNYKFIIPMYYPSAKRIQLLMPMYLECSYTSHPDFALILTPHSEERIYTPETILGLDEVYQDARLVAKPEESWLNPMLIQ